MFIKRSHVLIFAFMLLGGILAAVTIGIMSGKADASPASGGSPEVVAYQGVVQVDDEPYTGDGFFKFAVVNVDGDTTYWSNDGTSAGGLEPTTVVQLDVSGGIFSVLLGDTDVDGMTEALTANVFSHPERYLRVWFSQSEGGPFDLFEPDTRIAAAPYALQAQEADDADTVDGLHASQLKTHYENVVVVAQNGGDFTSVQDAIDSIKDAATDNPYLVWIAPGVYQEIVTMESNIHLQGAGQQATIIRSDADTSSWLPTKGTLLLASDTSLRDLTVENRGKGDYNVALLATAGVTRTLVADVTAMAQGGGTSNYAVLLSGSGTGVTLQQVSALAENGNENYGLTNLSGSAVLLHGGAYTGYGGEDAYGIHNDGSGATLIAVSVTALGRNGDHQNYGLNNLNGAATTLRGGTFSGCGGTFTRGINNDDTGTTLDAENVTALGENSTNYNIGLSSYTFASVRLHGGSFSGCGGTYAQGILNNGIGTMLMAENVIALAENGSSSNIGLDNMASAKATLHGGFITGYGGEDAYGILNDGSDARLVVESVTALGESGDLANIGLYNVNGAAATLKSSSFIGNGGENTFGIENNGSGTTLVADGVTALGENGISYIFGLRNSDSALAVLRDGSFTGSGGTYTRGIYNTGYTTMLQAANVTALAEEGDTENYGLFNFESDNATLRGGFFAGFGGEEACGIYNKEDEGDAVLNAEGVSALGEGGEENYGLYNYDVAEVNITQSVLEGATKSVGMYFLGDVTISNSRLVGGAAASAAVCVGVSRDGTFNATGCP
ncbi:MAG: hypothetical protein JXA42_25955 [Anaerolineales bacterium]|nr:hypothetical protein [Anaerolineales bacterium]